MRCLALIVEDGDCVSDYRDKPAYNELSYHVSMVARSSFNTWLGKMMTHLMDQDCAQQPLPVCRRVGTALSTAVLLEGQRAPNYFTVIKAALLGTPPTETNTGWSPGASPEGTIALICASPANPGATP